MVVEDMLQSRFKNCVYLNRRIFGTIQTVFNQQVWNSIQPAGQAVSYLTWPHTNLLLSLGAAYAVTVVEEEVVVIIVVVVRFSLLEVLYADSCCSRSWVPTRVLLVPNVDISPDLMPWIETRMTWPRFLIAGSLGTKSSSGSSSRSRRSRCSSSGSSSISSSGPEQPPRRTLIFAQDY